MIAFLNGVLREKSPDRAVIDIGGVGFEVAIPYSTFGKLPTTGEKVFVYTTLVFREDDVRLFGFATSQEKELFQILTQVPGIGFKTPLDILSTFSPEAFVAVIQAGDQRGLCRVPGIGKKRAERLIFDLKDKESLSALGKAAVRKEIAEGPPPISGGAFEEAVQALIALGCKPSVAHRAVSEAVEIVGKDSPVEPLIKEALKHR
ncbi:MAG TPA: Holliday junction branch migration protein RuvA [bacterium]|nr:Holliday junction branch migration protein RuvA [bacterium]HQL62244.1 Holliday junction branch migration protein RuvA [bacterium]